MLIPNHDARVQIYRSNGKAWLLQGTVRIPTTFGPFDYLHSAALTHSGAPDFVLSVGDGADWTPFTVVSRVRGKWRTVAFDYPPGKRVIIDAWRIRGDLVEAKLDSCGCAGGPETYTWYRFNGRIFVPTTPPGPGPGCTTEALDVAHPLEGDPYTLGPPQRLAAPFHVLRFTCLDGWALASDSHGRFALFNLQSKSWPDGNLQPRFWFRASAGSLTRVENVAAYLVITPSLLKQLEENLGPR